MVEAERHEGAKIFQVRGDYITTLLEDAKALDNAVRAHWDVENQLHCTPDVVFRADESLIRRDNAPANFNTLREFSLNLLNRSVPSMSVRQKRYRAGLDDNFGVAAKVLFKR